MSPLKFKTNLHPVFNCSWIQRFYCKFTFLGLYLGDDTADTGSFGKYSVGSVQSCLFDSTSVLGNEVSFIPFFCFCRTSIQTEHRSRFLLIRSRTQILFIYNNIIIKVALVTWQTLLPLVVDGDPHFVVHLPKLSQNLCFTVDGKANDVLRLLEDPDRGMFTFSLMHTRRSKCLNVCPILF